MLTEVDKVLAFLQKIIDEEITKATSQNEVENISAADQIKKFKDLANSGVITQNEFEAKKKQLLNL